jgi:hypothetical protein
MTMRFNAITYSNKLKNAGLQTEIADIHAEEMCNIINNEVATKQDLALLENKMIIKLGTIVIGCTFIISMMIGILGFILKQE